MGSEQPGPGATLLSWPKFIYQEFTKKHCMEVNARYVNQFVIVNVNRSTAKLQHFNCCLVRNEKLRLKL